MFKEISELVVFLDNPTREINVREYARLARISPATASKNLHSFAKEGILKKRQERMLILYKANLDHDFYQDVKVFYNIRKIKDSGLLEALNSFYLKPTVVLFGSASFGLDIETSDFDILIVSERTQDFPDKVKFEHKIKRPLQLFIVKGIKEVRNEKLRNNIVNGTVIQGKIQW